jgi:type IV pilus assembly protein PilV
MEQSAIRDKRGMTLIEIMISLLLLAIVAVALMQSSILVINNNIKNERRDEAVTGAEERMNESRNTPFANLSSLPATTTIYRNVRAVINFPFTASLVTTPVSSTSTQVSTSVTWTYRGTSYNHSVSTVLRSK